jgi:hypothetical protein
MPLTGCALVHVLLERAALVELAEPVVERHDQPEQVVVEAAHKADAPSLRESRTLSSTSS